LKIPFEAWFEPALKFIEVLEEHNLNYALYGAAAISLLTNPLSTKDIDILIHPFPNEQQAFNIISDAKKRMKVRKYALEYDAIEGNRIILIVETNKGPLGIDAWEKLLRRDPSHVINKILEIKIDNKTIKVLKPEALLATKLCELTPEPLDREKIERILKHTKKINIDEVVDVIYTLAHEWTAILNIRSWFPQKRPKKIKEILEKIINKLPPRQRNEALRKLRENEEK